MGYSGVKPINGGIWWAAIAQCDDLSPDETMGTRLLQIFITTKNHRIHLTEAEMKAVNIHESLDKTLLILQHRLKLSHAFSGIVIVKEYGKLSMIECYAGQINQVFMNLISNAIDAVSEIEIRLPCERRSAS
jgi:two-component system, NtrC family, sensor kinase